MRKLGIAVLVVLVLIIVALLVVPHFINVNNYRGQIQAELQKRLGRPVQLGSMHLSLFPPAFTVDNAVIAEDPRFGSQPFATVQKLAIKAKLRPLLHRQIEISSLNLQRPHVELIRNAQGQWNFASLGQPQAAQPSQPQPGQVTPGQPQQPAQQPPQEQAKAAPALQLDNLKISDGQVALTDHQKHQSRAQYDHIDLSLKNFAPDKQFDLSLAAHLPGQGTQTVSLTGKAGPIDQSNTIATPFDGNVKLNQVSIDGIQKFLNTQALADTAGVISGTASVRNEKGRLASQGSVTVEKPVIRGVNVGYPVTVNYRASDDLNTDQINIGEGKISLGQTPLSIAGTVNTRSSPAQANLALKAQDVSLSEVARLASAFGVAFNSDMKVDGRATADLTAQGPVNKPAMNGTMSLRNLAVTGQGIAAPVKVPALDVLLTPQQVRSAPFTATSENTSVNGQFTLTDYTTPAAAVDATLRTNNAQIANLISMAKAYGVSGLDGLNGSGLLTLDVRATGPVKDANAMAFNGTGQIQNASLQPPNLRQPVKVRNANLNFSQNGAQVQNLAASLGQTNASGTVTVRNFAAPNLQFNLTADKVNVTELQQITRAAPQQQQASAQVSSSFGLANLGHLLATSLIPSVYAQTAPKAAPAILEKMTGGGTLSIGTIQYDQLTLNNVRSNVTLNRGVIGMAPLTAQLYDGLENGSLTLDTRTTPMAVQVKSTLQRVQANPLISSVSSVKNTIYGLLAANAQTSFQAVSGNDIARTLNGTVTLNLSNGRITKLDLLNQLAAVGKFAGVRKNAQAVTDFTSLAGHFTITNGVASTNDLRAEIAGGSFAANGLVNLASQQLNMHLTAVLSKGFTQQIGGGVGGLMQTALANNHGELVVPVIITGTFDSPQVSPDLQKVAEMKLQNMLPTAANPGAMSAGIVGSILQGGKAGGATAGGLGGVVDAITGQQQQPAQQQGPATVASPPSPPPQQQQQPADAINQAVQGIFGGNNQKQKQTPPK
jgi:uncharacterized protein involved in outer membrane biogenesis